LNHESIEEKTTARDTQLLHTHTREQAAMAMGKRLSEQPKLRVLGRTSNKNRSSQRKSPRSRESTKVKNGGLKQDAKISFSLKSTRL
jgi:hypothetical protein